MRPRLREDVRFVEAPDGVYVQSDLGACVLRGQHAYAWLSHLAPAMTGEHALAELTDGLPEDKRDLVERLVYSLAEQRLVVDVLADAQHALTETEQRIYADEIAFVGYALDSPEQRFQRLRQARVTLIGGGELLKALLEAGLRSGWREVNVLVSSGTEGLPYVVARARRDPAQTVRIERGAAVNGLASPRPPPWPVDEPSRGVDVVLQVSEDAETLIAMCRACENTGRTLGQVLVRDTEAWLTQVGPPASTAAESGWRRLAALSDARRWSQVDWLTGPVPAVVAGRLTLDCFAYLTGLDDLPENPPAPGNRLTRVDLRTLDARPHRVLRHPMAMASPPRRGEAEARATAARLAATPPIAGAELLERVAAVVDSRTGLLGLLDEQGLAPMPLWVCRATLSDPCGVLPKWAPPPEVTGWGRERHTARSRAFLAALATYGTLAADPLLLGPDGEVWGTEVPTGRPRALPASQVYPVLEGAAHLPYRAPTGTAAGLCWADAVAAGLRDHCVSLLAEGLAAEGWDFPRVEPATVPDPAVEHLTRLLAGADADLEVRDLSRILGVPGYVFSLHERRVAVSCAATAVTAMRDGLERALLACQARTERGPAYADAVPRWLDGGAETGGRSGRTRLAEALRARGRTPVAVPLHLDIDAVKQLPFVVRVVLVD